MAGEPLQMAVTMIAKMVGGIAMAVNRSPALCEEVAAMSIIPIALQRAPPEQRRLGAVSLAMARIWIETAMVLGASSRLAAEYRK